VIDVDELVATACADAGTSDFGADTWQEGLRVLVDALNAEAGLNELGYAAMTDQLVGNLVNRLHVEQCYAAHPEIDDQELVAPLFGLGLPRTGSTALSFLLAQDPARRSLRVWEANQPCPPPETATEDNDPRIAAAQAGIEMTNAMFPGFEGMLPTAADGPQECIVVMASDFRSLMFEGMAFVPSYTEWLLGCDMEPAYRYHRRVVKLLQWHCPPTRWWLKSPAHMVSIDALDRVYPDARFVMTHRDVGKVLPSVCALYAALGGVLAEDLDLPAVGAHNTMVWRTALERLLSFRDAGRDDRFFDLWFEDVQRDPIGQVESLYARLGDELTDEARTRMAAWWNDNATHRSTAGHHAEEFGLEKPALDAAFAFYNNRFGSSHG
jgi:sulfotransferase family protein